MLDETLLVPSAARLTTTAILGALLMPALSVVARAEEAAEATVAPTAPSQDDKDAAAFAKLFKSWKASDRNNARTVIARPSPKRQALVAVPARQSRESVAGGTLTSGFGMRMHPLLGVEREHTGVDLAARMGTPVYATADGVVGSAGVRGGYGLAISIEHGGGMETRFGHLSRLNVVAGQRVRKGDLIGLVGSTGLSTGPHLHYETRLNGRPVNPMNYMGR